MNAEPVNYLKSIDEKLTLLLQIMQAESSPEKGKRGAPTWNEFVKHVKSKYPERFAGIDIGKGGLAIAKQIKEEYTEEYNDFVRGYKNSYKGGTRKRK